MISEGQIVLFRFPQTNQQAGKLRPALVVRKLPGRYEDWLISMVSSQLNQDIPIHHSPSTMHYYCHEL